MTGNILLLLFLVPTCQISMPTFSTRFYVICNIVDDDVEAAPIYRCDGKAREPIVRPCKNHDLHIEWEPTWTESQQKQQTQANGVPASRSLDTACKIQGTQ